MFSNKGVVYKLRAGWFVNCIPGEFIKPGLLVSLKVFSVEMYRKRGKLKILHSGCEAAYKSNPGNFIVCCK